MSNKVLYSIFIILFILMPISIISALYQYASSKLSDLIKFVDNRRIKTKSILYERQILFDK